MPKIKLVTIVVMLTINAIIMSCPTSSAHLINSTRIQDWKNVKDNIEIQFSYKPDKPIIDAFTELQFGVTNLQTGEHMKDFVARVVVTNGQRLFTFEKFGDHYGYYSLEHDYPVFHVDAVFHRRDAIFPQPWLENLDRKISLLVITFSDCFLRCFLL